MARFRTRTRGAKPWEQVLEWYQRTGKREEALASLYRAYAQEPAVAHLAADARLVRGEGPLDPLVMFVGEAPGANEDRTGRPFVGASGRMLNLGLESIGLDRKNVFITNTVKFRPPGNRDPELSEVLLGRDYLMAEHDIVLPRLVVPLGAHALSVVGFPNDRVTTNHGQLVHSPTWKYFPTFHPAACLRNPQYKAHFMADFQTMKEVLGI